jgi:uncharacterized membrane protein
MNREAGMSFIGNRAARVRGADAPAVLIGFGLGAFLDGIVLHQILQWHHLVVAYRAADDLGGLEYNMFWDGVFLLVSWLVVLVGLLWLWRSRDDAPAFGVTALIGGLLIGWGVFNIADQIMFHMALGAHHIRIVDNHQLYDWAYTAVAVALVLTGWFLMRTTRPPG